MRCEHVRSRLAIYADGELRGADLREVETHLDACPACADELTELSAFLFDAREALAPPEPTYAFADLERKMALVTPLDEVRAFLPKLRAQGPVGQLAAAALLVAIVIATPFAQRLGQRTYNAAKSPFDAQLARLDEAYQEYLDEDLPDSRWS